MHVIHFLLASGAGCLIFGTMPTRIQHAACPDANRISVSQSRLSFCLGQTTQDDVQKLDGAKDRLLSSTGISDSGARFALSFSDTNGLLEIAHVYVRADDERAANTMVDAMLSVQGANASWSACADSAGGHFPVQRCRKATASSSHGGSVSTVIGYYVVPGATRSAQTYNVMLSKQIVSAPN